MKNISEKEKREKLRDLLSKIDSGEITLDKAPGREKAREVLNSHKKCFGVFDRPAFHDPLMDHLFS